MVGCGRQQHGNLTNAENRVYTYNVENRLSQVSGASLPTRVFSYDGDGSLRTMSIDGTATKRYIIRDYQLNPTTGEVIVYYRFGGRAIAWDGNGALRYLLGDHLSSSQAEVGTDQADLAQRRFYPFGADRPATITGMVDLAQDERYTGQRRIKAGAGNNDRKELYHYGARFYLPGVGIFTQPDTIVPDPKNPQALNKYSYVLNNPLKYTDPTGNSPIFGEDAYGNLIYGADPNDYSALMPPADVPPPTYGVCPDIPVPAFVPGAYEPLETQSGRNVVETWNQPDNPSDAASLMGTRAGWLAAADELGVGLHASVGDWEVRGGMRQTCAGMDISIYADLTYLNSQSNFSYQPQVTLDWASGETRELPL